MELHSLKYPIGQFIKPNHVTDDDLERCIQTISTFPVEVNNLLKSCLVEDLKKTYRPEGWTINQLIHHCADSHMNAFIRFKLALTEDCPTIKPYIENLWAELPDTLEVDPAVSVQILKGIHSRWAVLLQGLKPVLFEKEYIHPEHGERFNLAQVLSMYDWHCRHHLAHIKLAINS